MRNNLLALFCIFTGLSAAFEDVSAASLYIDPAISTLNRGDAITMSVRLDTDEEANECVNAIDGVISYTANIIPEDVSIGDSIMRLWVQQPTIDTESRTITFAAGVPNGYCGRVQGDPRLTNNIIDIIFRSPGFSIGASNAGSIARVEFAQETTAYLNDAQGRVAPLTTLGAEITLSERAGTTILDPWNDEVDADTEPPEEFSIFLEKNPSGKYFVTFNTTDKQTGIDQYQVLEVPLDSLETFVWGQATAPWIVPDHPNVHVLRDQTLNSTIYVKAIDKAGNEYVAKLIPDKELRTAPEATPMRIMYWVSIAVFGLVVMSILVWLVFRYLVKPNQNKDTKPSSAEHHD